MKSILLIGLGTFGNILAKKLGELNHEVMAIDRQEKRVNAVLPFVTEAQIGDSTDPAFLKTLGIDNYDVCIVAIGDDFQSSLETTSLLKDMGAKKVISRACDDIHKKFLLRNGADEVVYPEEQLATWLAIRNTADNILDFIALDSEYAVYEIAVPEKWYDKSIGSLDIRRKHDINVLVLRDENKNGIAVNSETVFRKGQTVLALGKWKDIRKCFKD